MTTAKPLTLWTVDDVSAYLGVPVQTLYTWRKRRIGPPAGRVGRHLRYDPDAVRAWFEQQAAA
ncbi:helix-turn-helix domain-containing protein [Micromonospora arida]|uniref:Excisionase n=1 Tax=Micromonospora arida TaxID=2203715 RepID=A0A3N9X328_9ACTN|nr:helix-turn-helix domain-containing protein [Micromonospora arida]RQX07545.1 excisionase [Micromonospora arida]